MGRLARAFDFGGAARRASPENPSTDLARWVIDWGGGSGGTSASGMPISQTTAVRMGAAWRCARVLADGIASLPLFVMQRQKPRGRKRVPEHPLSELLHLEPNARNSSFQFRSMIQANCVFHGNGYSAIYRDNGGRVRELRPIPASAVKPGPGKDGTTVYEVTLSSGEREPWFAQDILHIPGLGFDGIKGMSVLSAARDALGIGLSLQEYGATLFKRGGRVPGIITTPYPNVDAEKRKNVRAGWDESVGGPQNWHTPAVFPKGWDYKDIGIKPDEAQWLESKKFSVIEVCRFFGVNPHKIYDYERATFTNFEQSSLSHVIDDLMPWVVCWEQELNRKLLTDAERAAGYFIEFALQSLMRGDTAARTAFYSTMRQWGVMSANDVRDLENMQDLGPQGDIYLVPFNMTPADQLADGSPAPNPAPGSDPGQNPTGGAPRALAAPASRAALPPSPAERRANKLKLRRKIRKAQQPIIEDRAAMIVKREIGAIEKELKAHLSPDGRARRSIPAMRRAIDGFYDTHGAWAAAKMQPILNAYASLIDGAVSQELGSEPSDSMPPELEKFAGEYGKRFGVREASEGRLQLLALLDQYEADGEEAAAEAVQTRLDEWGQKRPGKIALNESVQFMGGAAKTLYLAAGVTVFRWVANASACDFCQSLDGQTAGVEKNFVNAGQDVQGGPDSDGPMKPSDNIGHPPLHAACECDVVAD